MIRLLPNCMAWNFEGKGEEKKELQGQGEECLNHVGSDWFAIAHGKGRWLANVVDGLQR